MTSYHLTDPNTGERSGPHDYLSLLRRIKHGSLQRDTMVESDDDAPVRAETLPELSEAFNDEEHAIADPQITHRKQRIRLADELKKGWETFKLNQSLAVVSGLFMVATFAGLILFSLFSSGALLGVLTAIWVQIALTFYLATMLRKARMQLLDASYAKRLVGHIAPLSLSALITIAVPGVLPALLWPVLHVGSLAFFVIPGTLMLAWYLFLPLVMLDRETGISQAWRIHHERMRQGGFDAFTVIYGLLVLNLILPFPPITMPVTFVALCNIYDQLFNE